jgi:hypothetical protein
MSKQTSKVEEEAYDIVDADIADDDYVFVISADGKLKTVLLPNDLPFLAPKNVQKILKIFGVTDIENIDFDATIH